MLLNFFAPLNPIAVDVAPLREPRVIAIKVAPLPLILPSFPQVRCPSPFSFSFLERAVQLEHLALLHGVVVRPHLRARDLDKVLRKMVKESARKELDVSVNP